MTWGGPNGSFRPSIAYYDIYLHEGDVLKAVVTGTNPATITAYINDVEVMSAQDSGQFTSRRGGLGRPGAPASAFSQHIPAQLESTLNCSSGCSLPAVSGLQFA